METSLKKNANDKRSYGTVWSWQQFPLLVGAHKRDYWIGSEACMSSCVNKASVGVFLYMHVSHCWLRACIWAERKPGNQIMWDIEGGGLSTTWGTHFTWHVPKAWDVRCKTYVRYTHNLSSDLHSAHYQSDNNNKTETELKLKLNKITTKINET